MLLNIAHCECGAPYYSKRYESKGHLYEYYDCSANCGARRIPMAVVEDIVDDFMTNTERADREGRPPGYATYPLYRKITHHGRSIKSELNAIERKLRNPNLDDPDILAKQAELLAQRKHLLEVSQSEPDRIEHEKIPGMTVGEYWPTLDKQSKRQLLLEAGVTVSVKRIEGWKRPQVEITATSVEVKFVMLPAGGIGIRINLASYTP